MELFRGKPCGEEWGGAEEQTSALFYLFLLSTSWKEQGNKRSVQHLVHVKLMLRDRNAIIRF
jgi:hypothetical protein